MVFWRKKKQPPAVSCYGKLPATGDFVRHNATSPENAAYDNWLNASLHAARETLGAAFDDCYKPALGAFVYRGEAADGEEPERGMVGVWGSSGDSAGRRYPMTVASSYDYEELLAVGAAAPLALWSFLCQAYGLVADGRQLPVDTFLAQVAQLAPISLEDPAAARSGYDRWLQSNSIRAFWETTLGSVAARYAALHQINATIEIFRGSERPQTALALRCPILEGDAYAVAVWTDITLRLGKWERTLLNAFWTPQHDLTLHIGPPQAATFHELLVTSSNADHVTDLSRLPPGSEAQARAQLPAALAEQLDDPDKTIAEFLGGL
ncbi:MAG: type VI secretion system-associated protein TagF [Polyangiaceae bacterium]